MTVVWSHEDYGFKPRFTETSGKCDNWHRRRAPDMTRWWLQDKQLIVLGLTARCLLCDCDSSNVANSQHEDGLVPRAVPRSGESRRI
jgi:hypothetical protein